MKSGFDVIVLGAGIVGSACALECVRAGLRVGVVEAAVPGGGATAAGMGHVVVIDDSPAQLALTSYSRSLWRAIASELPAAVEYQEFGTIWVAADEEEMAEVHAKCATYSEAGIEAEILGAADLADAEPNLRRGLAGGLLVREDSVLYPPAAAGFLLEMALRGGGELIRGRAAIQAQGGKVVLEDGTTFSAGQIVVATGADARLSPGLPIMKRKGHLVITDRYPGFVRHQLVELGYLKSAHKVAEDSVAFNVQPRHTGQLLIGSSRQYGDETPASDAGMLAKMLARAHSYMPGMAGLSALRVWTGFRAASPDKLPYLGPTEDRTVFAAMGFEGLGITNALGAARLVADQMLGRVSAIEVAPYLPGRVVSYAG